MDEAYIDTELCTACNECLIINSRIFAYNDKKQAYVKDPKAGSFRDIVKAAEKCPVKIIHPGKPLDMNEKKIEKWIERAKKYN
ncbi:MAG: ferredoxin [Spirochaetia bacterium]|nr:ferredoxin [Spirochaetia bacterium]